MALTFQDLRDSIEQGGLLSSSPLATPTDLRYAVQQLAQTDPQYAGLLQQSLGSTYNGMQGLSSALWNGLQGAGQENTNYGSPEEATAAAQALLASKSGDLGGLLQQGVGTYQSQFAGPQDDDFFGMKMDTLVPLMLTAIGGGAASGLGLTGAGAGAFTGGFTGGVNTFGNGGSFSDVLKNAASGAAVGGAIGGVADYVGGAEGAPSYEAGGQSPAPWASNAPAWYQEMTQQSVAPWASSSPSLLGGMGAAALTPMEVPSEEWQNPPTPTLETPTATLDPSGTLPAAAATSGGLLDYLKANPRLVAGIAGGLLGASDAGGGSGGYSYSGPMPTITRGGWSPTATPTYAQPAAAPILNTKPGQANSGLWRFMGGGQ